MKQQTNIELAKKTLNASSYEEYKNLKIVIGTNLIFNQPAMKVWKGRQGNPFSNYRYASEEQLKNDLARIKANHDKEMAWKEERRKAKASFVPTFEVGDIFVASWGYDQTNVDAYQVLEKPSKHYAIVREIGLERVKGSEGRDYQDVRPVKDAFTSGSFRVKVTEYGMKIDSVRQARAWDGERSYYNSWYR